MNSNPKASLLEAAVEQTEDVRGNFKVGFGAIKNNERQKFVVPNPRLIGGSLDIDSSTKTKYPDDFRWDYAVEYNNETFFIEVHPGSTTEIQTVIAKLNWLKQWLKEKAPEIDALKPKDKRPYHWIFTSKFAILPNSRYAKLLSSYGIIPTKQWDYSKL
jgi:hypothetical protein